MNDVNPEHAIAKQKISKYEIFVKIFQYFVVVFFFSIVKYFILLFIDYSYSTSYLCKLLFLVYLIYSPLNYLSLIFLFLLFCKNILEIWFLNLLWNDNSLLCIPTNFHLFIFMFNPSSFWLLNLLWVNLSILNRYWWVYFA